MVYGMAMLHYIYNSIMCVIVLDMEAVNTVDI